MGKLFTSKKIFVLIFGLSSSFCFCQTVFTVDRLTDNNTLTGEGMGTSGDFRFCLSLAAANAANEITFAVEGVIAINDSLPPIGTQVTIDAGDKNILIDGQRRHRIFTFLSGSNVFLNRVNIYNGYAYYPSLGGGAIRNFGSLTVFGSNLVLNQSEEGGGAITNVDLGKLVCSNSLFSRNKASTFGGGIYHTGNSLWVQACTFEQDTSAGAGGAIADFGNTLIANSIFIDNNSYYGGAAYNAEGIASTHQMTNNVFYNNGSNTVHNLPAIYNSSKLVMVNNSIFSRVGGGVFNNYSASNAVELAMINNIVATENQADISLEGTISGVGFNNIVAGTSRCSIVNQVNGNIVDATLTGSLFYSTDNQFYQYGLSLAPYSAAIDAAIDSVASFYIPTRDINDSLRDGNIDIGAVEFRTLDQNLTVEPIDDKVYNDLPFQLVTNTPSRALPNFAIAGPARALGNALTITGVGVITVTALVAGDRYYAGASVAIVINVFKAEQSIPHFDELVDITLVGQNITITLSGVANSGLPVQYELLTDTLGKTASISGTLLHVFGVGLATVSGFQSGNENYTPMFRSVSFAVSQSTTLPGMNTLSGVNTFAGTNTSTGTNTLTGTVENVLESGISIFPNPNNGLFCVNTTMPIQIQIFNSMGLKFEELKIVHEAFIKLDVKGLYLLKISESGKWIHRKLLVE